MRGPVGPGVAMMLRLARRWENRSCVRARIRNGGSWIREPMKQPKETNEGAGAGDQDADDEGPIINTELLMMNTVILREMFDAWGMKPKVSKNRIQKEVGVAKKMLVPYIAHKCRYVRNDVNKANICVYISMPPFPRRWKSFTAMLAWRLARTRATEMHGS